MLMDTRPDRDHSYFSVKNSDKEVVAEFNGPITPESISDFLRALRSIEAEVILNKKLRIVFRSPGGAIVAMRRLQAYFAHLRDLQVCIQTQGDYLVASAAAVLLASGDIGHRSIYSDATFLFHDARCMPQQPLNHAVLVSLSKSILEVNLMVISELASICAEAALHRATRSAMENPDALAPLTVFWPLEEIEEAHVRKMVGKAKTFDKPEALFNHIQRILTPILKRDKSITPQTARALGLVDHITSF